MSLPKENRRARLHVPCGSDHIDVDPTRQSTRVPGNGVLACGQNLAQNRLHFLPSQIVDLQEDTILLRNSQVHHGSRIERVEVVLRQEEARSGNISGVRS